MTETLLVGASRIDLFVADKLAGAGGEASVQGRDRLVAVQFAPLFRGFVEQADAVEFSAVRL